jgi:hypothetical protein
MFVAYLFIVIGAVFLLNALGLFSGHVWGIIWAVIFLAIGFKLMQRKSYCPMCMGFWTGKAHEHFHEHWQEKMKEKKQNQGQSQSQDNDQDIQ